MAAEEYDPLEPDQQDALAASGRALASVIPMFGGVVGELITQRLPAQRIDRISDYIRFLEERVKALELNWQAIIGNAEKIDLIEEGGFQAARATSSKRIEQIAELVAQGLASEDANLVRRKRLASLLRELDDDEIVLLNAYGQSYGGDARVWQTVDMPGPSDLQSSLEELDAEKLYEAGRDRLLRLGLLQKNYRNPRRGEAPAFDTRKGDYAHSIEVSYLGRMLLRMIGQPSPYDQSAEG